MGQGHPRKSTRKRDRSILCIAQNSVIPFFPQKAPCCASYGFLYFAADTPPFEVRMRSNSLAHAYFNFCFQ